MRIARPPCCQPRFKSSQRHKPMVPVDPGQQDHIRPGSSYHICHSLGLQVGARSDITIHQPRPVAGQIGVKGGDAQIFGPDRTGRRQPNDQAAANCAVAMRWFDWRVCSIIVAIRPIAMPRMNRLTGRKAHAVTVQIKVWGEVSVTGSNSEDAE